MKIAFYALLWLAAISRDSLASDYISATELPKVPLGCKIHIYGPLKELPSYLPKNAKETSNWTNYYKSFSIAFKKGGFVYFYKPSETLIIATTQADFDLIETVMSSSPK